MVTENAEHAQGLERLGAALSAKTAMRNWAAGAELIEIVRAAHDAGWLEQLHGETTADELAAANGVSVEQVVNALAVLTSAGVVQAKAESLCLSPTFDALVVGDYGGGGMPATLDALDLTVDQIKQVVKPADRRPGLDGEQALIVARDFGVRPGPGARQVYGLLCQSVPEYRDRLEQGGPLLDVGCGIGGAAIFHALRPDGLLLMQELFPPLTTQDEPPTRFLLDRLAYRQRDIPFGLSAEDLAAEASAAGFQDAQITDTPLGRLILIRKPEGNRPAVMLLFQG
jgi:hypothetical protein